MQVITKKKLSVLVLNYNGLSFLRRFMPSWLSSCSGSAVELVIVDNGSNDGSVEFLEKHYPEVKKICFSDNYGFAGGYNRAVLEVDTPYLAFLNSDAEPSEDWLVRPLAILEEHPEVFAIQPKILSLKDPKYFDYAGAAGGFVDRYGYPFCRGRIFDTIEQDRGQYDDEHPIAWASGAALIIRRQAFFEVGGFDESFFAHQEEIDLAWRLHIAGGEVWYTSGSVVYHLGGGTLNSGSERKEYLNYRNNLLMLWKNLPRRAFLKRYRLRLFLDLLAFMRQLISLKPKHAWAIFRAHRDFLRRRSQPSSHFVKINDPETFLEPYNILYRYYLQGKKLYLRAVK